MDFTVIAPFFGQRLVGLIYVRVLLVVKNVTLFMDFTKVWFYGIFRLLNFVSVVYKAT